MSFKFPENREEAFDLAELAIDGLNAIAAAVGGATAGTAGGVLTVVRVILATIEEGFDGKITPERVREELAKLNLSLAANDDAADAALQDKFESEG
ncbi:MAG: hypothetical protein JSV86_17055 [Gemmatimonadota bacterium]|nr:MAG: hypothetical protein JSV86_17055 [Gemmatimonadota bacterium]